jgi:hypothetical protein
MSNLLFGEQNKHFFACLKPSNGKIRLKSQLVFIFFQGDATKRRKENEEKRNRSKEQKESKEKGKRNTWIKLTGSSGI